MILVLLCLEILIFSCTDSETIPPVQSIQKHSSFSQQDSIIKDIYKLDSRTIFNDFNVGYNQATFDLSCMVQQYLKSINFSQPVWSPDAKYLGIFVSSADANTRLYVLKINQGRCEWIKNPMEKNPIGTKISALMMSWRQSNPSEFITYYSDKSLFKCNIQSDNSISCRKIYTFQKEISDMEWDGKTIYVIMNGLIYTLNQNPKLKLQLLPHTPEKRTFNYCNLELHPNGKTIVYEQWNNDNSRKIWIRFHALKKGKPLINWKGAIEHSPALSPNGQYLAFISNGDMTTNKTDKKYWKIFVWDMAVGKLIQDSVRFEKKEDDANTLCWIDNNTLMYMSYDQPHYYCFQKWNVKTDTQKTLYIHKGFKFRMPLIPLAHEVSYCTCTTTTNCDGEYLKQRSGLIGYVDFSNNYMAFSAFDSSLGQYRLYIGKDYLKETQ